MHNFNNSTEEEREVNFCKYKASLVYIVISRTPRSSCGDLVSKATTERLKKSGLAIWFSE